MPRSVLPLRLSSPPIRGRDKATTAPTPNTIAETPNARAAPPTPTSQPPSAPPMIRPVAYWRTIMLIAVPITGPGTVRVT